MLHSTATQSTYLVLVRVRAELVTDLLRRRLLALGLHGRRRRVGLALELVTEVLGGRLLGVGLRSVEDASSHNSRRSV